MAYGKRGLLCSPGSSVGLCSGWTRRAISCGGCTCNETGSCDFAVTIHFCGVLFFLSGFKVGRPQGHDKEASKEHHGSPESRLLPERCRLSYQKVSEGILLSSFSAEHLADRSSLRTARAFVLMWSCRTAKECIGTNGNQCKYFAQSQNSLISEQLSKGPA